MINRTHPLPLTRQAKVLGISRGSVYYQPKPISDADLKVMRRMDEFHLEHPFAGSRMLAWRLSITMDVHFCLEAVEEAMARFGRPDIFNTDQGSQFTSYAFTGLLKDNGIRISMDGKGCWRDNVFIERLWKSIKYEEVYLKAYDCVSQARASIGRYLMFYNQRRPHSTLDRMTPAQYYFKQLTRPKAA